MSSKYGKSRYDLYDSGKDPLDEYLEKAERRAIEKERDRGTTADNSSNNGKILVIFLIVFGAFFLFRGVNNISVSPIPAVFESITNAQPSEDLLNRMNARMIEMGYTDLTNEQLTELRRQGVTATYISNIRSLGFTELTLENAVRLAQADVSSAFTAMLQELGYNPSIEDLINLRRAGVTAFYTSNVHDLGYRDVTFEQLIRMQRIGVSTDLIRQLQQERSDDIPLEEVIRYRISNQ